MTTISALRAGDTFRFAAGGVVLTLATNDPDERIAGLRKLTFRELDDPVLMPAGAPVVPVSMPRAVMVPCLLCKESFLVAVDLATDARPRCVICDACDVRVSLSLERPA